MDTTVWAKLGSQAAAFSFKSFTTCSPSKHMLFRKIRLYKSKSHNSIISTICLKVYLYCMRKIKKWKNMAKIPFFKTAASITKITNAGNGYCFSYVIIYSNSIYTYNRVHLHNPLKICHENQVRGSIWVKLAANTHISVIIHFFVVKLQLLKTSSNFLLPCVVPTYGL